MSLYQICGEVRHFRGSRCLIVSKKNRHIKKRNKSHIIKKFSTTGGRSFFSVHFLKLIAVTRLRPSCCLMPHPKHSSVIHFRLKHVSPDSQVAPVSWEKSSSKQEIKLSPTAVACLQKIIGRQRKRRWLQKPAAQFDHVYYYNI